MRRMPVISSDPELNDRITRICGKLGDFFRPVFLSNSADALEYMLYELPEVSIINFSDAEIDAQAILDTIKSGSGGISGASGESGAFSGTGTRGVGVGRASSTGWLVWAAPRPASWCISRIWSSIIRRPTRVCWPAWRR